MRSLCRAQRIADLSIFACHCGRRFTERDGASRRWSAGLPRRPWPSRQHRIPPVVEPPQRSTLARRRWPARQHPATQACSAPVGHADPRRVPGPHRGSGQEMSSWLQHNAPGIARASGRNFKREIVDFSLRRTTAQPSDLSSNRSIAVPVPDDSNPAFAYVINFSRVSTMSRLRIVNCPIRSCGVKLSSPFSIVSRSGL